MGWVNVGHEEVSVSARVCSSGNVARSAFVTSGAEGGTERWRVLRVVSLLKYLKENELPRCRTGSVDSDACRLSLNVWSFGYLARPS